ncbi:MAG: nitroreductase family protein [bacterium]
MELMDALMSLRAIRRFTNEPVTDEEVMTCLRASQQAPSGGNIQPWQFLVVTDPATKQQIGELYRRAYDRYEPQVLNAMPPPRSDEEDARRQRIMASSRHLAEHIGEAPLLVAFLMPNISMTLQDDEGPLDVGTPFASVYPAVQNCMLAARGLGIGTTLTTVYRVYQDELREALSIPAHYEIVALVPMGRPRGKFGVAGRRPAESVTHWNRFGEKRGEG